MTPLQLLEKHVRELVPNIEKIPSALPLPVKYDGMMYYFGKDGEIVADFDEGVNTGDGFRIRGWGRIQYLQEENKTPEQLQDECAFYIEHAINAYSEINLADVLQAINKDGDYKRTSIHSHESDDRKEKKLRLHSTDLMQHCDWDLTKGANGQSLETIDFLLKLLTN